MSSIGYIDRVTQEYTDHMTIFRDTVQSNLSVSVKYVNGNVSRYSIFKRFNQLGVWEEMSCCCTMKIRRGSAERMWDQQTMCASPGRRGWHKSNWGGAGCIVTTLIKYLGPGTGSNLYIMDSLQFISDIFPPQPSCVSVVCRCVMRGWMWRSRNNSNSYSRQGIICEYLLFVYLRVLLSSPPAV